MRTPSVSDIELGLAGTYAVLEGFSHKFLKRKPRNQAMDELFLFNNHDHSKARVLDLWWAICKARNDFIFEGTKIFLEKIILYANYMVNSLKCLDEMGP